MTRRVAAKHTKCACVHTGPLPRSRVFGGRARAPDPDATDAAQRAVYYVTQEDLCHSLAAQRTPNVMLVFGADHVFFIGPASKKDVSFRKRWLLFALLVL